MAWPGCHSGADLPSGEVDDLRGVALDALAMEGGRGDAASALVGFTVGGDEALAEEDFHALLGAVFAEGSGFVDEDFTQMSARLVKHDGRGERRIL